MKNKTKNKYFKKEKMFQFSNTDFIERLKKRGYSEEELIKITSNMVLVANSRLEEELRSVLSEEEIQRIEKINSQEEVMDKLLKSYIDATGESIEELLDRICTETEQSILALNDDLRDYFKMN